MDAESSEKPVPRAAIPASLAGAVPPPALVPAERVLVPFAGEGAGRGELSWGQRAIWSAMMRQGWISIAGVMPLPPGRTVQDVADDVSVMMGRYPSMRTRLRFDDTGRPSQELFGSGQIPIEVFDADDVARGGDEAAAGESKPEEVAEWVEARYRSTPRDFADEWPQRIALVRWRGQLTHMVVVTCHMVTDGVGVEVLIRQMAEGPGTPVTGMQQLEQVAWQNSAAGRRQSEASLRYWERMLRSIPQRPLRKSADPREPRYWACQLRSPAMHAAVPLIAERTNTDTSSVLLALYAVALGKVTAADPVVLWPLVNNRFRPGLGDVVCNVVQSGICVLEVEGIAFDEVVRRTWRAALNAYKNAYYDAEKHTAMVTRLAPDASPDLGVAPFFNDRRPQVGRAEQSAQSVQLTGRQLREAQRGSTFSWTWKKDNPFERMFLSVEDDPEAVELRMSADTHYFSPADIEELLRHMETVAIVEAVAITEAA
ncbi:condensation domain-containing protein [Actinocrinis sp.]|uniref:condensation domain-containing protein n=1 Tax=Actinocrinis sp. TaxID=1920516 RepID=UPI002DDD1645|nr:condensation domain-containing protein [Actinocrinis sp.]